MDLYLDDAAVNRARLAGTVSGSLGRRHSHLRLAVRSGLAAASLMRSWRCCLVLSSMNPASYAHCGHRRASGNLAAPHVQVVAGALGGASVPGGRRPLYQPLGDTRLGSLNSTSNWLPGSLCSLFNAGRPAAFMAAVARPVLATSSASTVGRVPRLACCGHSSPLFVNIRSRSRVLEVGSAGGVSLGFFDVDQGSASEHSQDVGAARVGARRWELRPSLF